MYRVTRADVLSVLSLSQRKWSKTIAEEVAAAREIPYSDSLWRQIPSIAQSLEQEGFAQSHENRDPEVLALRRGRPRFEYTLTERGFRKGQEASGISEELLPDPT